MFRSGFYQRLISILGFISLFLASPLALSAQTTQTEPAPPDLTQPTVLSRSISPAGASSIDTSTIPAV
ncbi:MAG TPA: hypothetical protein VGO69_09630, partial [Pyrinomonadaceae bacterium]|nr:hypothetical protein [Pyrinomonadaceae bacterium]